MPMLHPNLNPTTLSQPVLHWSRGKNLKGCNMPQQDLLLRAIDMIMSPPPLLHELHWLPIEYRIKFKILLLAYKSLNGKGSVYLKNIFKFRDSPHQLRSVDSLTLEYPRTRTSYGDTGPSALQQVKNGIGSPMRSSHVPQSTYSKDS